jgi:hypothetical protein
MDGNVEGKVQLTARPTGGIVSYIDWRVAQLARGSTQRVRTFLQIRVPHFWSEIRATSS